MSGGDPSLYVAEALPQTTREEYDGVLSVIWKQPKEDWEMFCQMLGLIGPAPQIRDKGKRGLA